MSYNSARKTLKIAGIIFAIFSCWNPNANRQNAIINLRSIFIKGEQNQRVICKTPHVNRFVGSGSKLGYSKCYFKMDNLYDVHDEQA